MDYKKINQLDDQDQDLTSLFETPEKIDYKIPKEINIQEIADLFTNINKFYLNCEDNHALTLLYLLQNKLKDDMDVFQLFDDNKISSILLHYLSDKFDETVKMFSMQTIVFFTKMKDERYLNQFLHLSIFNQIKPFFNESNPLRIKILAIQELAYAFNYTKSLNLLEYVEFSFNKFFNLLLESGTRFKDQFKESFNNLTEFFLTNTVDNAIQIVEILNHISEVVIKVPLVEMAEYDFLLEFVVNLTKYSNFEELIKSTSLIPNLIDLIYKVNDPNQTEIRFVQVLLALIVQFTHFSDCPEINGSFFIDFYFKFNDPRISPLVLYIIGNICRIMCEAPQSEVNSALSFDPSAHFIEEAISKGFIKELARIILNGRILIKTEALNCMANMISSATLEMRAKVIQSSGLELGQFAEILVDSISEMSDDTSLDRFLAVLRIFEDVQKINSRDDVIKFIEISDIGSILNFEFNCVEMCALLEKLRANLNDILNAHDD